MILDGERLTLDLFGRRMDPAEHLMSMYPRAPIPPLSAVVLNASPLAARVNHGIWIASCPCGARGLPRPGGVVFTETPLIWCLRCQNGATGRGWRPVAIPAPEERERIEAVLLCRPRVEDRNWEPGETIEDLIAQNREHGDPVPAFDDPERPIGPELGPDWRRMVAPFGRRLLLGLGAGRRLVGRR